jgi:hypothetical protein
MSHQNPDVSLVVLVPVALCFALVALRFDLVVLRFVETWDRQQRRS